MVSTAGLGHVNEESLFISELYTTHGYVLALSSGSLML